MPAVWILDCNDVNRIGDRVLCAFGIKYRPAKIERGSGFLSGRCNSCYRRLAHLRLLLVKHMDVCIKTMARGSRQTHRFTPPISIDSLVPRALNAKVNLSRLNCSFGTSKHPQYPRRAFPNRCAESLRLMEHGTAVDFDVGT